MCRAIAQELNSAYIQWFYKKQVVHLSLLNCVFPPPPPLFSKMSFCLSFPKANTLYSEQQKWPDVVCTKCQIKERQAISRLELFTDIYEFSDTICYTRAITAERYVQDVQCVAWCYASSASTHLAEKLQWSVAKMLTRPYVCIFSTEILSESPVILVAGADFRMLCSCKIH